MLERRRIYLWENAHPNKHTPVDRQAPFKIVEEVKLAKPCVLVHTGGFGHPTRAPLGAHEKTEHLACRSSKPIKANTDTHLRPPSPVHLQYFPTPSHVA